MSQWQDEPDGDGWYWVEDFDAPQRVVRHVSGEWKLADDSGRLYALFGRVCKITERPE